MLMQFDIRALEEGRVEFGCTLDESVYNPIGVVHGGLVCTLLDTVAGCAVHTTLPQGFAYTSIELKVNYLRAVHATSGPLTAIGRVVKPGRRVAFAEGEVLDAQGRTVATASSSLLVFPLPTTLSGQTRLRHGGAWRRVPQPRPQLLRRQRAAEVVALDDVAAERASASTVAWSSAPSATSAGPGRGRAAASRSRSRPPVSCPSSRR